MALVTQKDTMTTTGNNAVETLKAFEAILDSRHGQIISQTGTLQTTLNDLTGVMTRKSATIGTVSTETVANISAVRNALEEQAEQIINVSNSFAVRSDSVKSNMERTKDSFVSVANESMAQFEQAADKYQSALTGAKSETGAVIELIDAASARLNAKVDNISEAASIAKDEVHGLAAQLEHSAHDIHLAVNQAAVRVDKVREDITSTTEEIDRIILTGTEKMENAGITFGKSARAMDETGERIITRFDEVGSKINHKIDGIDGKIIDLAKDTETAANRLIHLSTQLDQNTVATVSDLQKSAMMLENKANSIRDELSKTIATVGQFSGRVKGEMDTIVSVTDTALQRVSVAADKMISQGDAIDITGTNLYDKLQRINAGMSSQTATLVTASDKVTEKTAQTIASLTKQVQDLDRASTRALEMAEKIKEKDSRVRRESFLASTKFVVESLHSLSVDFTRMIDGELPDKTWKAYQKGDTGAFTRRLVAIKDSMSADKIKTKFAEDVEFRTYIQRYLRQFEEVYDQAHQADHADLLTTVFLSSDVGKLYGFICTLLGREQRGKDIADRENAVA